MRATLATVVGVLAAASLMAQGATGSVGASSSGVLSPTVLFAVHMHNGTDDVPVLDALVMLRGTPGWYARTPRGASVLSGATTSTNDGRATGNFWASGGGYTILFDSDSGQPTLHVSVATAEAKLFDEAIASDETNVILIDGVDDAAPQVQKMRIDARLEGTATPETLAVRKSTALIDFVQCDTRLPDAVSDAAGAIGRSLRNAIARSCDAINGVAPVEAWAGTWGLNLEESTFPPDAAPRANTSRLEREGDHWNMTTDGVDGQGNTTHTQLTAIFDGKDYPVEGTPTPNTTYAFTKVDDYKYELVAKRNGVVYGKTTTVVSPDGQTRTSMSTSQNAQGETVSTVAVYDRQ
jgi:hypothetical protein